MCDYLDTVGLKAFCPVGVDCFVSVWYDQAGSGYNAIQNSSASQPLIVINGIINRVNNNCAVRFISTNSSSNDWMQSSTLGNYTGVITSFAVFNYVVGGSYIFDQGFTRYIVYTDYGSLRMYISTDLVGSTRILNTQYLTYSLFNSTTSVFTVNTNTFTGTAGNFQTANIITLGAPASLVSGNFNLNGNIQEFVTYRSNQSANQATIRSNINSFYSVY